MTTVHSWQQQCQAIHNACSNNDWSRAIQECNELIQYAQRQSAVTAAAATERNDAQQLQLHIQAHAQQD